MSNNIQGYKNINQIFTTMMDNLNGNRQTEGLPSKEKHSQSQMTQKYSQDQLNPAKFRQESIGNHKNGDSTSKPTDLLGVDNLLGQIKSLDTVQNSQIRLRYESQAFVLRKRRNNLFRGFENKGNQTEIEIVLERSTGFDSFPNRKKPASKNAIKTHKMLNSFLMKGFENIKSTPFLEFLSSKLHIPLEPCVRVVSTQAGYKQADIRRVRKYHVAIANVPPLGSSFDADPKSKPVEQFDEEFMKESTNIKYFQEEIDCFETRQDYSGYTLPETLTCFSENKREIFKVYRVLSRLKYEKQSSLKRLAYLSVKEVERRYIKCLRNQNDYVNRAKKLQRQCLVYWRKREKELTELKKKRERLEGQLKKRDEEEQEAKKQQKRLQYIMYQSGLYSHFMATKLGVEAAEPKKEFEQVGDIDKQAAQLSVNQIINNKMENLEKFDKKSDLDLSEVSQVELVGAPTSFHGILKEYQIKGLRWLNNLFEQGINGILADEMGLGKTIQAIALLAHISTTKNVWGPFLIVAPNSTLYNWQQEFKKFCPSLKVLPYWGNIKQRKVIRKFFSGKKFTDKADSPFHVVITSYQLTVTDEKTFKRLKWQFMILDEAQAIKNILSQRWNTLKEFQSRNRLLLTGTPIQNNMAELWALLNFVMPDLFDSHELFNEWFSKDIEAHSQDQKELDQIKIQRLHAILKPFMLRRIKKDVEHEIGKKHEHQVLCEMTKRQKLLYQSIKERLNVKEFFKMYESKAKVENLMNLVMQLRKVCNHPELFQRRPARSPFMFQEVYYYTGYTPIKSGDLKLLTFNPKNPIFMDYPKLMYDELRKYAEPLPIRNKRLCNIFAVSNTRNNPTFSILSLCNLSLSELELVFREDNLYTGILILHWLSRGQFRRSLSTKECIGHLVQMRPAVIQQRNQIRSMYHMYMTNASAATISMHVSCTSYVEEQQLISNNTFQQFIMHGKYSYQWRHLFPFSFRGLLATQPSLTPIEVIDFGNLIGDSSKLRELDRILKEKKDNGDKVLIFCQMTKMIDILEDFMNLRKYTFFRLDGSSNIADRRDMVNDFQKPTSRVFVFLLSTRAGGLGVTLTAANTVIFYDNDWNPTMDAQATDRAHRIGQSRDVNVYQLVTKSTIEERIVKRAQQKKTVQSTVYEGASSFNFFKKDIILELMVDQFQGEKKEVKKKGGKAGRREERMETEAMERIMEE